MTISTNTSDQVESHVTDPSASPDERRHRVRLSGLRKRADELLAALQESGNEELASHMDGVMDQLEKLSAELNPELSNIAAEAREI